MSTSKAGNIDEYIAGYPENVQNMLQEIRKTIRETAPEAEEMISYAIPAFKLYGRYLIYFAAHKTHIGLYPVPTGNTWDKEFAGYTTSGKGTIQFPLHTPLPLELIAKIVRYRMQENLEKAAEKKKKK